MAGRRARLNDAVRDRESAQRVAASAKQAAKAATATAEAAAAALEAATRAEESAWATAEAARVASDSADVDLGDAELVERTAVTHEAAAHDRHREAADRARRAVTSDGSGVNERTTVSSSGCAPRSGDLRERQALGADVRSSSHALMTCACNVVPHACRRLREDAEQTGAMPGDETDQAWAQEEEARRDLERARGVLDRGRRGASDEWLAAAEAYLDLARSRYGRRMDRPSRADQPPGRGASGVDASSSGATCPG